MAVASIKDLKLAGKRVLVRCDFNVPLAEGKISDTARIDASLDTIRYILAQAASPCCARISDAPRNGSPSLSLKPVAEYLTEVLGHKVALAPDCIGDVTGRMIADLKPGDAMLLENLRFHPEEEKNDRDFSHELARGKQAYVNDAFGTAHRAHASTVGVTAFISERAAGFLMMRELDALRAVTENPRRPSIAIMGGAKVSDKIGVIRNLMTKVDAILIGGAMAYTFLKAKGAAVGRSRVEEDKLDLARELMAEADRKGVKLVLPCDHVVASAPEPGATTAIVTDIPSELMGLDIGPATVEMFKAELASAKTVIWNGPLGFFEIPEFAQGTLAVGVALANLEGVTSIIGGGDTAAAIAHEPWASRFTHISTGGGATLEYLEGIVLPGVKALQS